MNDIIRQVKQKPQQPQATEPVVKETPQAAATNRQSSLPTSQAGLKLPAVGMPLWLRWLIGSLVALFLLICVVAGIGYFWYNQSLAPKSSETHPIAFVVSPGASSQSVATNLANAGLVQSGLATQIYMYLNGKTAIKAGNYRFSPNQSVAEIVGWLNDGRTDTLKVTILPGKTLDGIKKDLMKYGYSDVAIDAAFAKAWNHPLLASKPAGVNIEGYIYPETFFMEADSAPEDVLKRSFDEFQSQLEAGGFLEKLSARGFSVHQGITLASIVSAEVTNLEDRRKVAQVFEKRLQEGMVLGSDVTYIYAAKQLGVAPSSDIDSPYNTRKFAGLPPGAIGNFNLSALEAVVNPASTTYLYFVAGDDGVTHYGYTLEEHQANIAKYCQRLCANN